MNSKIFISHGDLIVDHIYDGDLNLLKKDGGGSNWNSLYNLAYLGENCYAVGSCGLDEEGDIALSSLSGHGVHTELVKRENIATDIMNIIIPNKTELSDDTIIHSWYSPITNKRTLFFRENLPATFPNELLDNDLYILLDKFEPINLEFLNHIPRKKVCLDVGHIRFIEHFSKQYLITFFKNANLLQLNSNVAPLLLERLQIQNEFDLFSLLDLELLVITKGKKGATFIFKENSEIQSMDQTPDVIAKVVDSSGAGDAFFATLLKQYAYHDKIDSNFITQTFQIANKASREVIGQVGSRRI